MAESLSAQSLLDAAAAAAAAGDASTAADALGRALAVQEATLGPTHAELATTLNNLAVAYEWLGQDREAERCYRRSHDVARAAFPANHPQVVTTGRNLGEFCRTRGLSPDGPELSEATGREVGAGVGRSEDRQQGGAHASIGSSTAPQGDRTRPAQRVRARPQPSSQASSRRRLPRGWTPLRVGLAVAAVTLVAVSGAIMLRGSSARTTSVSEASSPALARLPSSVEPTGRAPGVAPGAVARDASREAGAVRETDDRSDAAADAAQPDPPALLDGTESLASRAPADPIELEVVTARLCDELTRARAQWTCRDPVEPLGGGRLYFYTRIASAGGAEVEHHWYRGDELVQRVALRVAASAGAGYRTFSQQTVRDGSGDWRVELRSGDAVLHETRFVVR